MVDARKIPVRFVVTATLAALMPHTEKSRAHTLAATDNTIPSVMIVKAICRRDAPSDDRIASSCARRNARVSMMLAALTHAMRTTTPAAPSASSIHPRTCRTYVSFSGTTAGRQSGDPTMF